MPYDSLRAFVDALRKAGELCEIGAQVDPRLEIAEITDRVVKAGGPALLFTDVKGSKFPVLTNQFGTQRRMAMALDAGRLDDVAARVRSLIEFSPPGASLVEKAAALMRLAPLANAIPKTVRDGSVHDVVMKTPDLTKLPILTTWPLDGGPFITLPLVITERSAYEPAQRRHVSYAGLQRVARPGCTGSATSKGARTPTRGERRSR